MKLIKILIKSVNPKKIANVLSALKPKEDQIMSEPPLVAIQIGFAKSK